MAGIPPLEALALVIAGLRADDVAALFASWNALGREVAHRVHALRNRKD